MKFVLALSYAIAVLLFFGGSILAHESAHKEIYRADGIDSRISFTECFPDICVIAEEPCKTESCRTANNLNEVFFYPMVSFMCMIVLGFFTLILLSEMKEEILIKILQK